MSNTVEATPYESYSESSNYTAADSAEVSSWLHDTDEDRAIDERAAEARHRQMSEDISRKRAVPAPLVSINLHMKKADTLLRSVVSAGYKIVKEVPRVNTDFLILQNQRGGRIALEQIHSGGVRLHAVNSRTKIDEIVRRHTVERAIEHLTGAGLQVTRKDLPNGETQLLARRSGSKGSSPTRRSGPQGAEELHAQIRRDGSSVLDVVDVQGPRCEEIANAFAEATSTQITATKKKDDYYCLPGQLRRERVHVK